MKQYHFFLLLTILSLIHLNYLSAQWSHTNGPDRTILSFTVIDTNLFTGTYDGGVFRTSKNITNWTAINSGLSSYLQIQALTMRSTDLFAGTYGGGVFQSYDNGANWHAINTGLTNPVILCFAFSDTNLFAGTNNSISLTINNGTNWMPVNSGLPQYFGPLSIVAYGKKIFVATLSNGVYKSSNLGDTWTSVGTGLPLVNRVMPLVVCGSKIFIGTDGYGVFSLTTSDTSWINAGLTNRNVRSLVVDGTNIFAGTGDGVFLSTNMGTTWTKVNDGFLNSDVYSMVIFDSYLYAGTNIGIWRRPLSEMIPTGVEDGRNNLLISFSLNQNFPNPFNPSTTIEYNTPTRSRCTIQIFDILGRRVDILYDGEQSAGYHQLQWNANVSSGIYFYRIEATALANSNKHFVDTKKMLLLK